MNCLQVRARCVDIILAHYPGRRVLIVLMSDGFFKPAERYSSHNVTWHRAYTCLDLYFSQWYSWITTTSFLCTLSVY